MKHLGRAPSFFSSKILNNALVYWHRCGMRRFASFCTSGRRLKVPMSLPRIQLRFLQMLRQFQDCSSVQYATWPRLRQENYVVNSYNFTGEFCRPAWGTISITTIRRGINKWSNVTHCVQQEIQRTRLWAEGHGISWNHRHHII